MKYYDRNITKLPLNKPIYGFAYSINDDTRDKRLSCLPVLGEIGENNSFKKYCRYCFYPYKKGTKTKKKSGVVDFMSRYYTDTYEEAIEMYNELVQKRIDKLKKMIKEVENDKIK